MIMIDKNDERRIIQAQPGWYVAFGWHDPKTGQQGVSLDVVIAWLMVTTIRDHVVLVDPYPITADGANELRGDLALKDPDGRFVAPGDRSYDTEAEFLNALAERRLTA